MSQRVILVEIELIHTTRILNFQKQIDIAISLTAL